MIHSGLPIEGILERSNHPFHEIVKRIQPYSPVTTHLVGNPPQRAPSEDSNDQESGTSNDQKSDTSTDRESGTRESAYPQKSEKKHVTSPSSLINQPPPVEGSINHHQLKGQSTTTS